MAKVSVGWKHGHAPSDLRKNLRQFAGDLDDEVLATMRRRAPWAANYLKSTAPWTDDTGLARQTLTAVAHELGPGSAELVLSYAVNYGVYLEMGHHKEYAAIQPALRVIGEQVMRDLNGLIDRMQ